jgi:DNA modification methylase
MTPYYEESGITIYHGDCRDVLDREAAMRTGRATYDLLLTDPPYGIGEAGKNHASRGKPFGSAGTNRTQKAYATEYGHSDWDDKPADEAVAIARSLCRWQIVFGGNYYDLPPASCWLVWDKDNGKSDFADCELAWTNLKKAVRKLTYRWNGMLQEPGVPREHRQHPTQKPEAVIRWALMQAPQDALTVLDPFMGSGTTLVAAKRLGRRAIGIEREERYCAIAAERLRQGALFGEATA